MVKITHIVVHYTASFSDTDVTAADVTRWHRQRGFWTIGYHYFIRLDGTLERGRREDQIGAHVGGQNTGKIGVCWAGGLVRGKDGGHDTRTPAQTATLIRVIRDLKTRYPNAKVVGHRDLAATECPGFDVPAWWASVEDNSVETRLARIEARLLKLENKA